MQLRQYQLDAISGVREQWSHGHKNACLVLPTGAGKTVVAAHMVRGLNVPTMCIAHRQELIQQISETLAAVGIQHKIIAPESVQRFCAQRHIKRFGKAFTHGNDVMVASVQTLVRRQDKLRHLFGRIKFWFTDECFPAGTLVDGRPIETLQVGDLVTSFNERDGTFHKRPVTAVMKNEMPQLMVRLRYGTHHVLTCTPRHPIWTKRGWVEAGELNVGDEVLHVRGSSGPQPQPDESISQGGVAPVLQQGMQREVSVSVVQQGDGGNKQKVCVRTDEAEQPHVTPGDTREGESVPTRDEAPTESARWEWQAADGCRGHAFVYVGTSGLPASGGRIDGEGEEQRLAQPLQDRLWSSGIEDSHRSGRVESRTTVAASGGRTEGLVSNWMRVDSVTFLERNDPDLAGDGYVYNIEVADHHTYVADGVTVHNCHHCLEDNQWGKGIALMPDTAIGMGVTATPLRADKKGLDGVFDTMVVGPSMRDLITQGHLTDYRIFCPPVSINRDAIRVSKSSGEFIRADLVDVSHRSSIVGDVVTHYQRIAPGKRGLTFAVDLTSAREITDAYNAAGVPALYVDADTPDRDRADASEKLRSGEVLQLVNVDLFGEGYDVPAVEVVSMARPTQSYGLYSQQFGRALRPAPGKPYAIIIDHVGNVVEHGLPDQPRQWTLEGGAVRSQTEGAAAMTVCAACMQPRLRVVAVCPYCGHQNEPQQRGTPEQVDGDLMELDPSVLAAMRGEMIDVDAGEPAIPYGASGAVVGRKKREWGELCAAQRALRETMERWCGVYHHGFGEDDRTIQRRFFLTFGMDVLSAQALRRADAEKLRERIENAQQ